LLLFFFFLSLYHSLPGNSCLLQEEIKASNCFSSLIQLGFKGTIKVLSESEKREARGGYGMWEKKGNKIRIAKREKIS
jgi:hypothetical protein